MAASGSRCRADSLDNDLAERIGVAESFHGVEDFDAR
jgi:hypothetical protein